MCIRDSILYSCTQLRALPEGIPPRILALSAALAILAHIDRDISSSVLLTCSLSEGFGQLENLRELNMTACKSLLSLPDSFCDLSNLTKLTLGDWNYGGQLTLDGCHQLSLPESFIRLQIPDEDFMKCCKAVARLPESIVEHHLFKDAAILDLSGAKLVALPERIGDLKNLRELKLAFCKSLEELPAGIPAHILPPVPPESCLN